MPASQRRFLLRERTSERHSIVDATVGSLATLDQYTLYLQGVHDFRLAIEHALSGLEFPSSFQGWRPESISEQILMDMNDLAIVPSPQRRNISLTSDLETVLGALYVVEGSSLGARVLFSRAVALGLHDSFGARHLARQSASQGWKAFLEVLDAAPVVDMEKVIQASQAVFILAEKAFKEV